MMRRRTKYVFYLFLMSLTFGWACLYVGNFFKRTPATAFRQGDADAKEKELRDMVGCALGSVAGGTVLQRAEATLDFVGDQLVRGFDDYGISSDIEKIHFLAQVMHESNYFVSTVESAGGATWETDTVFDSLASSWKCGNYLNAIHSDKKFFDEDYDSSNDSYKAAFRGRGLIQLTHCYNYVHFFYHEIAKRENLMALAEKSKIEATYFYKGMSKKIDNEFCEERELEIIAKLFENEGIYFPRELTGNFENTVDRLSLPCGFTTVSFMQSPEFLVGTSLWFWQECKRQYPDAIGDSSDRAVGKLSECVNGSELYFRFDRRWCRDGSPDRTYLRRFQAEARTQRARNQRRTILASYCRRLHNFDALSACAQ